jgi:hypothetical protein
MHYEMHWRYDGLSIRVVVIVQDRSRGFRIDTKRVANANENVVLPAQGQRRVSLDPLPPQEASDFRYL